ncbi:MAG: lysophospholipid acyltransferase family protein, partial [Pseudomonadota bacterium]
MRSIIAFLKWLGFVLGIIGISLIQPIVFLFTKGTKSYIVPYYFHNIWRMTFAVKYVVKGTPCVDKDKQVLYMGNHISYLDIPVVGSVIRASFVAKSEVDGWPLAGFLCSLQQTAFIQRKQSKMMEEKNKLQTRIDDGDSLIIFPEGTSTSGFEVLPFKSSLFMLALGENNDNLYIQPFTIRVLKVDGKTPANKDEQDIYAWPRDVDIDLHHHL